MGWERRGGLVLFVLAVCVACLTGCVTAGEGSQMQSDIKKLQLEVKDLQDSMEADRAKLNETLSKAMADVERLDQVLKDARDVLGRNNADLSADLEAMRKAIDELRGQLDVRKREFDKLQQTFDLFQKDVDSRLSSRNSFPADPDELWALANQRLEAGEAPGARQAFERFRQDHGSDSRAAEAQVKIGETYLIEQNWTEAARIFTGILKNSSTTDDVRASATFNFGNALVGMNRCSDAQLLFEEVVSKYRRSSVRKDAQKKISLIKRNQLCK